MDPRKAEIRRNGVSERRRKREEGKTIGGGRKAQLFFSSSGASCPMLRWPWGGSSQTNGPLCDCRFCPPKAISRSKSNLYALKMFVVILSRESLGRGRRGSSRASEKPFRKRDLNSSLAVPEEAKRAIRSVSRIHLAHSRLESRCFRRCPTEKAPGRNLSSEERSTGRTHRKGRECAKQGEGEPKKRKRKRRATDDNDEEKKRVEQSKFFFLQSLSFSLCSLFLFHTYTLSHASR